MGRAAVWTVAGTAIAAAVALTLFGVGDDASGSFSVDRVDAESMERGGVGLEDVDVDSRVGELPRFGA